MVELLRILIVEDVPSDAALMERELRHGGLECITHCVETEPQLLAGLADFKPDIVLSDYSLPSFNGMDALRLVQQRSPATPLIIVTGSLSEETAAECIKAGAADYVLKEHLTRLPAAVRGALERCRLAEDKRRAEEALRHSEAEQRAFFDASADGVCLKDAALRTVMANPAYAAVLGRTMKDVLGRDDFELMPEAMARACRETDLEALGRQVPLVTEEQAFGRVFETRKFPVPLADGSVGLGGYIRDVTEYRKAETALRDREEIYSAIVNQATDGIALIDPETLSFAEFNDAACRGLGYSRHEFGTLTVPEIDAVLTLAEIAGRMAIVLETGEGVLDVTQRCKNGTLREVRISNRVVKVRGHEYIAAIWSDVTETKRAEAVRLESERQLTALMANVPGMVYRCAARPGWPMVFVSEGCTALTGWPAADVMRQQPTFSELVVEEERQGISEAIASALAGHKPFELTYRINRADGRVRWVWERGSGVFDPDGHLQFFEGFVTDITPQKAAEGALQESEVRFRTLFDSGNDAVFLMKDGRFVECNARTLELFGCNRNQILNHSPAEFSPETQRDGSLSTSSAHVRIQAALAGEPQSFEWLHCRHDRSVFDAEVSLRRIQLGDEAFLQAIVRDITERKRADELRAAMYEISEAAQKAVRLNDLFAAVHRIVGRLMEARNLYIALYDSTTNLLSFPYFVDEVDERPETFPAERGVTSHVVRTGQPLLATPEVLRDFEERGEIPPLDGASVDWLGVPLKVEDRVIGVLAVQSYSGNVRYSEADKEVLTYVSAQVVQVIERKRAEETLRESEQRYRLIAENAADVIWTLDLATHRMTYVSPSVERLRGFSPEEVLAQPFEASMTPDSARRVNTYVAATLAAFAAGDQSARTGTIEVDMPTKDGGVVRTEIVATAVTDANGRVTSLLGVTRDITERKQGEEERRRLVAAIEQAAEAVVITDPGGVILYVNPAFEWITGYRADEAIGSNTRLLKSGKQAPAFYAEMWTTIARGSVWTGRLSNRRKDGSLYEEEMSISPVRDENGTIINYVAVKRDVTRELELQQQLAQAQKMEAIGRLAGGVAHDFNNLLQALISHVQLLRSRSNEPEKVEASSREMEQLIGHGASLTRQLLLFSRRETVKPERLDLNEQVREASKMLQRVVKDNIALRIELAPQHLHIDADRGQLDQVLMNLVVNASDAMPDGGQITIRTGATNRTRVWLSVKDTGVGIPEEIRERIFEPFFTTKGAGKGTGLGLSVVHGIVTRHGGQIEVESELGRGATFRVSLPAAGSGEFPAAKEASQETADLPVGKGERVLVVEDEELARKGLHEILASFNYKVVSVGSGEAAGSLPADPPFDLLLTDLMLPGVAGPQLAAGLKERWPELKVILMSGYTEDETIRSGVGDGTLRFLQKPFDMAALAREVRAALDE